MFLLYYLIRELVLAHPTVYFRAGCFYIFTERGVHLMEEEPLFGAGWEFTTFLADADVRFPPPGETMIHSALFVLAESSPRPGDHRWVNQRLLSQEYVLNPPSQDELVKVSVRSFVPSLLCSHSSVSLI